MIESAVVHVANRNRILNRSVKLFCVRSQFLDMMLSSSNF